MKLMRLMPLIGLLALTALSACATVEAAEPSAPAILPVSPELATVGCAVAPVVFPDYTEQIATICAINAAALFAAGGMAASGS